MISKIKKPVSILLALMMVVSLFTIVPMTVSAATWTFKLNSNFSGEWATEDLTASTDKIITLAPGDYEFQVVAYEDGNLSSYRGNELAGSFTDNYSQIMCDNGGNAKFKATGGKYVLNYDAGTGMLKIDWVPAAQIGETKYGTLETAVADAVDGDTITLLANCAGNGIKAPQGKFATGLTVDFNEHTYTVDGETVGSTGTETNGFQLLKDNKITFKNGTITSEKAKILVQNYSDLTLNNMTLTLNNPNYTSAYTLSNNNGDIVIDGTTIKANPAGGFAFDVCRFSSYPSVNVTVKGNSQINGDVEISASGSDAKEGFSLKLESGDMSGDIVVDASAKDLIDDGCTVTKAADFEQDAPADYKWDSNGKLVPCEYVAENTTTGAKYETLEAAFAAAQDGNTITLLADCAGNGIKAPQGKFGTNGLTVDFAGHTYTVDGATVGSTGTETNGFQLLKDNKITFKNGTITSEKAKILVQNYSDLTLDKMTLTLNNPNYTSAYTLSNNNGDIVIDGTTINANPAGAFAFDVCRYASYPSVNVTVKGNSQINGNVEVSASGNNANDGFSLKLESGKLNGDIVLAPSAKAAMAATPEKAVITKEAAFDQAAPADYKWDSTGKLVPCKYVAQIGDNKYETLEAAFAAAQDGNTITLLADCTGNGIKAPQGKFATNGLTVDFAGHTYTVDGATVGSSGTETQAFQLLKNNKITFKGGTITSTTALMLVQNYSDLTLKDMTLDGSNLVGNNRYTLSNNNGNVVIDGSTITAKAGEGNYAFDVCRYSSYPSVNVTVTGNSQINGDVEISASGNNAKDGFSLKLESGKLNGDIVLDPSAKAAMAAAPDKAVVSKAATFEQDAPEGYKWDENNVLVPDYAALVNGTGYMTFAEAAAAANGETITLLKDAPAYVMTPGETLKVAKNGFKFSTPTVEGAYVVNAPAAVEGVNTYTVSAAKVAYTTAAGKTTYSASLPSAFSSGTYKLLDDITRTTRMTPGVLASNVTLDLNGHTLTSTASDYAIVLTRAGSAASPKTFALVDTSEQKGGKLVVNPAADQAIAVSGKYNNVTIGEGVTVDGGCVALTSENQNLTVNGTVNGGNDFAVVTNGKSTKNANITINDGAVVTSNVSAIYLPGTGTTTINGGTIEGKTAIYQKSGTLHINGGTIKGTGAKAEYSYNGNGANATGDAIVVDSCGYPGGTPVLTISGNPTITSTNGVQIGDYTYQNNTAPKVTATSNTMTLPIGLSWIPTEIEGVYTIGADLFVAHSITLNGNIELNFFINPEFADFEHANSASVKFSWDGEFTTEVDLTTAALSEDGWYKASVEVYAAQMANAVHAEVYLNNEKIGEEDYTVREYAEELYNHPDQYDKKGKPEELRALAKALLNYGAMAQTVFAGDLTVHPADFANANLDENDKTAYESVTAAEIGAAIQGTASDMDKVADKLGGKFYTSSVIYLNKNKVRLYFTPKSYPGTLEHRDQYTDVQSEYYYYVDSQPIPAAKLDQQQYFSIGGVDFNYSALDYAKAVVVNNKSTEAVNLAKALFCYYKAARAYIG